MKKTFLALILAPVFAMAAPSTSPFLSLSDGSLRLMVARLPGAGCPTLVANVSIVEVGRSNTMWASQKVAVPLEHNQTDTCTAIVEANQWAGQLREGQRLAAHATVGRHRTAVLNLVSHCSDQVCKLAEAGTIGETIESRP